MIELPAAARARIERVLAELEIAVMGALQTPPPDFNRSRSSAFFVALHAPITPLVLEAFGAIVAVVRDLPCTASERRQTVARYQDELLATYALERSRFLASLRTQSWWLTFQQTLRDAERTDVPPVSQQLEALRQEARWTMADLATHANIPRRTVERHLSGTREPTRFDLLTKYEAALKIALGRDIRLQQPVPAPSSRRTKAVGKKPVKRR